MRFLLNLVLVFNLTHSTVLSNVNNSPKNPDEPKSVTARSLSGNIVMDGQLNEDDWQKAEVATDFVQFEPIENGKPTFNSEVRILYGSNAIYIGAMLYDSEPQRIFKPLGRRDEFMTDDRFSISMDSYFDKKTAYIFMVSAANVQTDAILTENGGGGGRGDGMDRSWDAVWESNVRILPNGWSVEMKIPYSMLRFNDLPNQTWGMNCRRSIGRLSEINMWQYIPRSERYPITKYGHIKGLNNIKPRKNVQMLPYTLAQLDTYEENGKQVSSSSFNAGADVKYSLSSNSILDLSINPDFGQVESDPAELNLTTFETVLQEKRPFFIEGSQIFDFIFGGMEGGMLYTRRIGASDPDTGEPDPIIGSLKLSGQTQKGMSYGVLGSVTGADFNPNKLYTATRLKQNIGKFSKIGGGFTFFNRQTDPKTSMVGGIDWDLRNKTNTQQYNGHFTLTQSKYANDPDSDQQGFIGAARTFKTAGMTTWGGGVEVYSPDADPGDVGRLRDQDYVEVFGNVRRYINDNKPFGIFNRAQLNTFFWNRWTYSQNVKQGVGLFLFGNGQLKSFQNVNFGFNTDGIGGYDMRETRDIDMAYDAPQLYGGNFSIQSDSRRKYRLQPRINFNFQEGGGKAMSYNLEGNWIVSNRLNLNANLSYQTNKNYHAWVANEAFMPIVNGWGVNINPDKYVDELTKSDFQAFNDGGVLKSVITNFKPYEGTTDRYYLPIFGKRNRQSIETVLRTNVTFTPNISFQLYSQLFVARGKYDAFEVLATPDKLVSFNNYPKRRDFNLNNYQSNAVLRWEYRPGSTIYVVWSQSRGDSIFENNYLPNAPSPYLTNAATLIQDTFGLVPTNAFLIKFNYLFLR